jgi:Na+-transporting methylmalonyl-CoA/oxaloacetate decarboxylase gamma subunit
MIAGVSVLLLFFLAVIVSVISTVANILLARPLRATFGFEIDEATAKAKAEAETGD